MARTCGPFHLLVAAMALASCRPGSVRPELVEARAASSAQLAGPAAIVPERWLLLWNGSPTALVAGWYKGVLGEVVPLRGSNSRVSWSADGRMLASIRSEGTDRWGPLVVFDADGTFTPQQLADVCATVHWSPNRARLAAPCRDPDRWLLADFTTGRPATREIRLPGGTELSASWAPDSSSIVFLSTGAHPPYRSYWLDLRGRPQEPVALGVASEALGHVCQWSEDSRRVVCNGGSEGGERGLYLVALDGEVPVVRRLSGTDETGREWCLTSADWVVFQTRHSGLLQAVRTDAAPGSEAITLHHAPRWNWAAHQTHVTRTGACGDGQRVGLCLGELSESGFRERLLVEGELSAPSWSLTGGFIRVKGTIGTQSGQWLIDPEERVPTPILLGREGRGVVSISQDLSFVVANDEPGAPMLYLATGKREPLYLPGEGLLRSLSLSPSSDAIAALRLPPGSTRETELLVRSVRGSSLGAWIAAKLPANPPSTVVWQPRSGDLGRTPAESYPWCNPRVVRIAGG